MYRRGGNKLNEPNYDEDPVIESTSEEIRSEPINEGSSAFDDEPVVQELNSEPRDVPTSNSSTDITDTDLKELLAKHKATIKVVGCGGAGNNTVNRLTEVGIVGVDTIAINTDAQDLLHTIADKKILIGKDVSGGLGAGSVPKIGEESAKSSENEIKRAIQGSDMVFVTCGLGGGTGTGSAPVVCEIAKKMGCLTVAITTLPFAMEGHRRYENAVYGLERLEEIADTVIIIPNDKLLELAPDLPLHTSFKVADEILTNAVKSIAELVTKAGLVNLDFADIRAVMGNGGVALIGVGESDSESRAAETVEKAIMNPLLDVDITGATGALINISGGLDLTLDEAKIIVETITEKLDDNARVIWGAQISEDLEGMIRTMLIVTGVQSSQILGREKRKSAVIESGKKKEIENELGIQFV